MNVTVAATQMACTWDIKQNIEKVTNIIHKAADLGAEIIQVPIHNIATGGGGIHCIT